MTSEDHDIQKEVKRYILVFVALLFFTIVTVAVSYLKLSITAAIILALCIATFKATLVACFFMHLISEKKLIYFVLICAAMFFIGLLSIPYLESLSVPEGTQHLEYQHFKKETHHVS